MTDDPVIVPTAKERAEGRWLDDHVARAASVLGRLGFLQIDDALDPAFVEALARAYAARYSQQSAAGLNAMSVQSGDDRRFMVTVDLEPPFDAPELYANSFILPVIDAMLGGQAVITSAGAVTALPGAADQHVHKDHPSLFPEVPLDSMLPCVAVTLVIPLVSLDRSTVGTTAVWLGSHHDRKGLDTSKTDRETAFYPQPSLGSAYLMDYRLVHAGTANRSDRVRPILYTVYARPWFVDAANFATQPPLRASAERLAAVPAVHRRLFAHLRPEWGPMVGGRAR